MVVMRDVCHVERDEALAVCHWVAQVILAAAVA